MLLAVAAGGCLEHASAKTGRAGSTEDQEPSEQVVTLFSTDELLHAWNLTDNVPGMLVQKGQVRNRGSQLMFGRYLADGLAVAMSGAARGRIVDIGDLRVGGTLMSAFHGLKRDGDTVIAEGLAEEPTVRRFELPPATESVAKVPTRLGSIYLVRLDETPGGASLRTTFAVLRVIEHTASQRVTLRWRLL